jgi:hypothetical protein
VRVNGADASYLVRKQTDAKLALQGTAGQLGLRAGPNEITVTVNGRVSNTFVLNL